MDKRQPHALLTRPPLSSASIGRILFPQILVRLACVKHAARVRPDVYKRQAYHRSGQRICVEIPRCGAVGTPAAVVGKIDVKINGRSARKNC